MQRGMLRQWRCRAVGGVLFKRKVVKRLTTKRWFLSLSFKKAQVTLVADARLSRHTDTPADAQRETKEYRKE